MTFCDKFVVATSKLSLKVTYSDNLSSCHRRKCLFLSFSWRYLCCHNFFVTKTYDSVTIFMMSKNLKWRQKPICDNVVVTWNLSVTKSQILVTKMWTCHLIKSNILQWQLIVCYRIFTSENIYSCHQKSNINLVTLFYI